MELEFKKKKIEGEIDATIPNTTLYGVATMDMLPLNEFILHSIPPERVLRYLIGTWNFATYDNFDNEKHYGIAGQVSHGRFIHLWIRKKDEEAIKEIMGKIGWFCGVRDIYDNTKYYDTEKKILNSGLFGLQFERKAELKTFDKNPKKEN